MQSSSSQQTNKKKIQLHLREWVAIALVLGFFASVSLIAHFTQIRGDHLIEAYLPLEKREIEIVIKGAVKKPGIYSCRPGTSLKKLLDQAGISDEANRRKVPFKKILFSSQTIEVLPKKSASRESEKISLEKN